MRALIAVLVGLSLLPLGAWADLFRSESVKSRNIASIPKWTEILARTKQDGLLDQCSSGGCDGLRGRWWEQLQEWRGLSRYNQMVQVNRWLNRQPYIEDITNWGRSDYWETPRQFLTRSGDCEDYSIVKYYSLKALGWPEEALRLVVLRDTLRDIAHAVLAVEVAGETYILDNLTTDPLPESAIRHYSPYYAVNAEHRWVFLGTIQNR